MPLITVSVHIGFTCPFKPFPRLSSILTNYTKFAVEQTNSILNRYGFTSCCVVTAHQIRCLTTSNLQTVFGDVLFPCLLLVTFRKLNLSFSRNPRMSAILIDYLMIEHILTSEPSFINQIVLCIADPRRSEYFCLVFCTINLKLLIFQHTRHDDTTILADNLLRHYLVIIAIAIFVITFTLCLIIVSSPEDVSKLSLVVFKFPDSCRHSMVYQQFIEHIRLIVPDVLL